MSRNKLEPKEKELWTRVDEGLHYLWDPISVSDVPEARDEYSSYIPQVFKRVVNQDSKESIAKYLVSIETDFMGLSRNKIKALDVAKTLLAYREMIFDDYSE